MAKWKRPYPTFDKNTNYSRSLDWRMLDEN